MNDAIKLHPAARFYAACEVAEATKLKLSPITVGLAVRHAKASWLSKVTTEDCQTALATVSKIAIAALLAMTVIAVVILFLIGMSMVLGYELWAKHRMNTKVQAFAIVAPSASTLLHSNQSTQPRR